MGIFSTIMDKIFHHEGHPGAQAAPQQAAPQQARPQQAQPQQAQPQQAQPQQAQPQTAQKPVQQAPQQASQPAAQQAPQPSTQQASQAAMPQPQAVNVEAVLSELAQTHGGGGNWRSSIVDLLKVLDMDSSLHAREELADELDVHVGPAGSAEENIALHHAVMAKLAQNGGHVPPGLRGG